LKKSDTTFVIIPSQHFSLEENLAKIILEAIAELAAAFDCCDHQPNGGLLLKFKKLLNP
jgi:hypothetical protein